MRAIVYAFMIGAIQRLRKREEDMKQEQFDNPGSLMQQTRELVKASELGLLGIYKSSGLPFYWLRKFASGEFRNPSVNRVQFLYEHLTGKSLLNK